MRQERPIWRLEVECAVQKLRDALERVSDKNSLKTLELVHFISERDLLLIAVILGDVLKHLLTQVESQQSSQAYKDFVSAVLKS